MKKYKRVRVAVTSADIKRGRRADGARCPVARAIRAALPDARASVLCSRLLSQVRLYGYTYYLTLPKKARDFIVRFDYCKSVKPFSFILRLPMLAVGREPALFRIE